MSESCCSTTNEKKDVKQVEKLKDSKEITGNITCPECGHVQPMTIPTISCQAFYKCKKCEKMISAKKSCCVFCDYGDRKCPVAEEHAK